MPQKATEIEDSEGYVEWRNCPSSCGGDGRWSTVLKGMLREPVDVDELPEAS